MSAEKAGETQNSRIPAFLLLFAARFIACWRYPVLRFIPVRIFLLLFIAGICAARAALGLRGIQSYSHDAFMLLDGAWRMVNGQRPHIDFYSHLGVLTFVPTVAGFWITHGKPASFAYGQGLTGLVLGVWAYVLGRRFLTDVPAVLMTVAVTLMAASPSLLGFTPFMISSAMTYNRCGYAILSLILVEVLAPSASPEKRNSLLGGISTGTALALLLFLKITYFVFAAGFVLAMLPFRPRNRPRWIAIAVTFLFLCLVCSAYFGFDLKPMLNDLLTVAASKHLNLDWYMGDVILEEAGTVLVLGLMASWFLFLSEKVQSARLLAAGTVAICAIGVALIFGNYEQGGFPLAVFLAIIVVDSLISQLPLSRNSPLISEALVLSLGSVFISLFLIINLLTMGYAFAVSMRKASRVAGLATPILKTFVPVDSDRVYAKFVNDGLALVQKYRHPGETVMSLDFTNPFSYGLGAKPAPGGNTVMQYKTTFNDRHRQSAESLFGSADLVAIPKPGHFSDESLDMSVVRLYGTYLEQHFKLIGESQQWKLYRRTG